jgi:hypothetical protein
MGFFKKIFKPVSRVLDKIIPNEIKPALPFAAAFAPYLLPTGIMGAGMAQRALMGGGLNILGQLSQEGNEGDINVLSAGLGALTGAMTAPGSAGGRAIGDTGASYSQYMGGDKLASTGTQSFQDFARSGIERFGADSAIGEIAKGGIKAADFMQAPGLLKYTTPVAQGTGDLMFAQAKRDQDEYDRMMEEESEADAASDATRAFAIRRAMEAQGATEEEILDAIAAAGYKAGGRVGFQGGGMDAREMNISKPGIMGNPAVMEKIENMREFMIANPDIEDITDYSEKYESKDPDFKGIKSAIKNIDVKEKKEQLDDMGDLMAGMGNTMRLFETPYGFDRDRFESMILEFKDYKEGGGNLGIYDFTIQFLDMVEKDTLKNNRAMAKEGGLMDLGGKEMDLRKGGFVPIGKKERADDVPARLSKNEFVMTADAVRAAGGGSVNEGAKRMYKVMNDLEARA